MKLKFCIFFFCTLFILTFLPAVSVPAQEPAKQTEEPAQEEQTEGVNIWADEEMEKIWADEDAEIMSNEDVYWADYADDSRLTDIQQITLPFIIYKNHEGEYEFPYTDDFFRYSSDTFSKTLAQASMGLEISAFCNSRNKEVDLDDQFTTYLGAAGFTDIYTFGYDQPTSPETLSGLIAHKKIDDFTLIACAPCGQGYEKEWGGNLMVGDRVRHAGFKIGAEIFKKQIALYREKYGIEGKMKIWIAGFSRAAAVGNLTAADLYKSGEYADIYAYLFGVPQTTKTAKPFQGIYNICGQYDPVPSVPLQSWFYERYGITLYTPAQESTSNYSALVRRASKVHQEITGTPFRNNPEVNHQLHLLIDFMAALFPTSGEYIKNMQGTLLKLWTEPNQDQIFNILGAAMLELKKTDKRYEDSTAIFLNYISFIASEHLSGNERQIEEGSWDPDATLAENLLREHSPATYLAWIFSDSPAEEIFLQEGLCRRVMIDGKVDVDIYDGDILLSSVESSGNIVSKEEYQDGDVIYPDIAEMRLGAVTTVYLPVDRVYRFVIHSDSLQTIYLEEILTFLASQHDVGDYYMLARLTKGDYELIFRNDALDPPSMTAQSGTILSQLTEDYDDSSALMSMADESTTTDHITIGSLLGWLVSLLGVLVLLGLICLIIAIIHKIKMKKGHPPYSHWWVIIPHLILIVFFALLTQYVSEQMVLLKVLVSAISVLTMLFLFLLALRAFLRKKGKRNLIVMILMLVLGVLSWLFFNVSPFAAQNPAGPVLYFVLIALLTVLAILGFFRKQVPVAKKEV